MAIEPLVSLPEMGIQPMRAMAEPAGHGRYVVPELDLLRPGRWTARLDLLIDDFTKVMLSTDIPADCRAPVDQDVSCSLVPRGESGSVDLLPIPGASGSKCRNRDRNEQIML
jgi:hypothetical protein